MSTGTSVKNGGAYPVSVEAAKTQPGGGHFWALYVHTKRTTNFHNLINAFKEHDGETAAEIRTDVVWRLGEDEALTTGGKGAAAGWVAAHQLAGAPIKYRGVPAAELATPELNHRVAQDAERIRPDDGVEWVLVFEQERPRLSAHPTVRGGSNGLAGALAYLDFITVGDLTGGMQIAATGTINETGLVGAVGSVAQKTEAALALGADVVFVPAANETEAQTAAAGRINVVAVSYLADAASWLCQHHGAAQAVCRDERHTAVGTFQGYSPRSS